MGLCFALWTALILVDSGTEVTGYTSPDSGIPFEEVYLHLELWTQPLDKKRLSLPHSLSSLAPRSFALISGTQL